MRSLLSIAALLGLGVALFSFNPARAEDEKDKPKEGEKVGKLGESYDYALAMAGAYEVARAGKDQGKPELLAAAATALASIPIRKFESEKDTKVEKDEAVDLFKEAKMLLKAADALAKADTQKALVKAARAEVARQEGLEKEGKRGAIGGPQARFGTVSNFDRFDTYFVKFRGGQQGVVWVHNRSGGGDIDLTVIGPKGGKWVDRRPNASASVSFYVPANGTYQIIVKKWGKGGRALSYRLTTN